MNWLTEAFVNKHDAAAKRLSDAYAWHKALWEAFPDRDGEARDFLFRLDDRFRYFRLYALSFDRPTPPPLWGQWRTKPIAPTFLQHDAYRFQLKANPTMRRHSDRKRLGIYAEDRLREWIFRKSESFGFDIDENILFVGAPIDETFRRNGRPGKHTAVDFQGLLRVTDRPKFQKAFQRGIGSAKAFGFGMLMLQPIG